MKRLMGYEFERTMATLYTQCPRVLRMEPADDDVAREGVPDRIVFLDDGSIRVCSWKCHTENASIKVKDSPEIRLTRELLKQGKNAYMVLEGLFDGRFFSIRVDPFRSKASVRIRDEDFLEWPPDVEKWIGPVNLPASDRVESPSASSPASVPSGVGGSGVVGEE